MPARIAWFVVMLAAFSTNSPRAQQNPAWTDTGVLVNHVGFLPKGMKCFVFKTSAAVPFQIIDTASKNAVYSDTAERAPMDIVVPQYGPYVVGDFTALIAPGIYRIQVGGKTSRPFAVSAEVYRDAERKHFNYFTKQRCGNTTKNWRGAPCHLDDGKRLDNGQHQGVVGGWHDAHDVRKWLGPTLFGLVGISRVMEIMPQWDPGTAFEELRWGNTYFLKMQEPQGYAMEYCAGDDGNYWSDSRIGTGDDRPIHTGPATVKAQYRFIWSEAALDRMIRGQDSRYADSCWNAAIKCYAWTDGKPASATEYASAIMGCLSMYKTLSDSSYSLRAVAYAESLMALQVTVAVDQSLPIRGFFRSKKGVNDYFREWYEGNTPPIALGDLIETLPNHPNAARWKESLRMVCHEYMLALSKRNAFSIAPYAIYGVPTSWSIQIGQSAYSYRYGDENNVLGMNSPLASSGIAFAKAAAILNDTALLRAAQRQLDWIFGANPLDASTVTGVGYNVPDGHHNGNMAAPNTPDIDGGVMNGIMCCFWADQMNWQSSEYWTPHVAHAMWLEALLSKTESPVSLQPSVDSRPKFSRVSELIVDKPGMNELVIRLTSDGIRSVTLYTMQGRPIARCNAADRGIWKPGNLKPGWYLLACASSAGISTRKLLVGCQVK